MLISNMLILLMFFGKTVYEIIVMVILPAPYARVRGAHCSC